jgi:N-acetyl-anhydromuramyl-L-alanine amidase AmpD
MGSRKGVLAAACVLLAAFVAASASAARMKVLVLRSGNHTDSNRTARTIERIVIHSTEGRFLGSVRWLRNRRSGGSAHFVVSRRGQIVQLVSVTDVAWHSGNNRWNRHSIGIEHEGWTGRGGFTEAEYRASARLVAYLAHRYGIALDRAHVVGHNEVPNPYRRGLFGGVDGHRDPGASWNWRHYMALARAYSVHPEQPRYVRRMRIVPSPAVPGARPDTTPVRSVVDRNATVRGIALWWSGITGPHHWRKHVYRAEFLVDGRVLWVDHTWPFAFRGGSGWDSRTVANGRHMLVVRGYGRRGYRSRRTIPVRVHNPPIQLELSGSATNGGVQGLATVGVRPDEPVERIALYVDGRAVSRDASAPYELLWDTSGESEGRHDLVVYARGRGGRRAAVVMPVVVANATDVPVSLQLAWGGSLDDHVEPDALTAGR